MKSRKHNTLSPECQSMLASGIGYRTESYGGSGVRDAIDVIRYECLDMGNTDIIETMLRLYRGNSEYWDWLQEWHDRILDGEYMEDFILTEDFLYAVESILYNELPI